MGESENLFGDLGPDVFGETDITDADFSFFDEQPGDDDLGQLELPDVPSSTATLQSVGAYEAGDINHLRPEPHGGYLPKSRR